jgi:hypothetical protein
MVADDQGRQRQGGIDESAFQRNMSRTQSGMESGSRQENPSRHRNLGVLGGENADAAIGWWRTWPDYCWLDPVALDPPRIFNDVEAAAC